MATANERKALWFLAFVALSGSGVRVWRSGAPPPPAADGAALARQIGRVDSARATRAAAATRPARQRSPKIAVEPVAGAGAPVFPVDLDVASSKEIERLPGIGPQLALRIVREREKLGPFGGWVALDEVKGIGPSLRRSLDTLVRFSAPPRSVQSPARR